MLQTHRAEVVFSGTVQGVGFRYTAASEARGFNVTGYVRNQPDGRVHLVAEGAREEVDKFVAAVKSRMSHFIREAEVKSMPATGEFVGFSVKP